MSTTTPAAARMRRLRERRARGARIVALEIDADLLELLEQSGLVGPDEADDPAAMRFALLMLLTEAAETRRAASWGQIRYASPACPGAGVESRPIRKMESK